MVAVVIPGREREGGQSEACPPTSSGLIDVFERERWARRKSAFAHPAIHRGGDHAALALRWRNMMARASSSISALNTNLSFSAIARTAAGLDEISSTRRFTLGNFANVSSPTTNGASRAQPHNAMSTMV